MGNTCHLLYIGPGWPEHDGLGPRVVEALDLGGACPGWTKGAAGFHVKPRAQVFALGIALDQAHGVSAHHHSVGFGEPLQPRRQFGVSPTARRSCRPPPPISPTTTTP